MSSPTPADGLRGTDLVRALVVPVLLATIALVQIARVHTLDQSPWSGAGFGMFASIDGETSRSVVGVVVTDDGATDASLPRELRRQAFELAVVPSASAADDLAERWAEVLQLPEGEHVEVTLRSVDIDDELRLTSEVLVEGSSQG